MEHELNNLATELFRTFARFEYALKAAGFHKGNGAADANWREFAVSVAALFDDPQDEDFKEAIAYILDHPPNKQMVEDGVLSWDAAVPQTDLQSDRVLIYVRRVRNNLFHGGKFNGRWFAPQRSVELLRHSLTILNACLAASESVNEAYHS
ncbi:hypothetical protein [Fodinicurvata sediminis]|uniref:hypothetical protein n=1 Tax=Fodinicurvata sediminis TaxID=1121832 RepID=UPI0003B70584|nr:hypothetical protein [Fodinicurvata sediminis]